MANFIQYVHHGALVWVREDLKGKHREICNCYKCSNFHPGDTKNCERAQEFYALCVKYDMTTPVLECPAFNENTDA